MPSYLIKNGATYRVVADERGTPRRIVDVGTGSVAQALDLDEFGMTMADSAPGFQSLGYASGIYDVDTGLVHFGSREYAPFIGRWMSKDPARLSFGGNAYAYVANDPINYNDATGLMRGPMVRLQQQDVSELGSP